MVYFNSIGGISGCFPKVGMKVFGIIEGVEIYEDEMVWIAEEIDWK